MLKKVFCVLSAISMASASVLMAMPAANAETADKTQSQIKVESVSATADKAGKEIEVPVKYTGESGELSIGSDTVLEYDSDLKYVSCENGAVEVKEDKELSEKNKKSGSKVLAVSASSDSNKTKVSNNSTLCTLKFELPDYFSLNDKLDVGFDKADNVLVKSNTATKKVTTVDGGVTLGTNVNVPNYGENETSIIVTIEQEGTTGPKVTIKGETFTDEKTGISLRFDDIHGNVGTTVNIPVYVSGIKTKSEAYSISTQYIVSGLDYSDVDGAYNVVNVNADNDIATEGNPGIVAKTDRNGLLYTLHFGITGNNPTIVADSLSVEKDGSYTDNSPENVTTNATGSTAIGTNVSDINTTTTTARSRFIDVNTETYVTGGRFTNPPSTTTRSRIVGNSDNSGNSGGSSSSGNSNSSKSSNTSSTKSPQTSDASMIALTVIFVLSGAAIFVAVLGIKRKRS